MQDITPTDLKSVKSEALINEQALDETAERLTTEYRENKPGYDRFQALRESAETTPATVRRAVLWSVASIKTGTTQVDNASDSMVAGDFSADKSALLNSTDGQVKWDHYHPWFTSEEPEIVAELLNNGDIQDAHARLAGRNHETGEKLDETYLRACKGAMPLYLLGYDTVCLDTRIFRATKRAITALFQNRVVGHPETELDNPYRSATPRAGASKVPVISHSGDMDWDSEKSYWEDKLKWNIPQYTAMTGYLMDVLAERSGVPREVIPQVAFNTEGPRTFHTDLLERLA